MTEYEKLVSSIEEGTFCAYTRFPTDYDTACVLWNAWRKMQPIDRYAEHYVDFERIRAYTKYNDSGDYKTLTVYIPYRIPRDFRRMLTKHLNRVRSSIMNDSAHDIGRRIVRDYRNRFRPLTEERRNTVIDKILSMELRPDEKIYRYSQALGVEIEGFMPFSHRQLQEALPIYTRVKDDGSIRVSGDDQCAAEVAILLDRSAYELRLKRVTDVLDKFRFGVNKSCGLHVHLDTRGWPQAKIMSTKRAMLKWLNLLAELVPESRRANRYCSLRDNGDRYCAVNHRTNKETLEIRLHSGTTDHTKICMWIRLCELLAAIGNPKASLKNTLQALESLPLCEWDKKYWRKRHQELNPAQYEVTPIKKENE